MPRTSIWTYRPTSAGRSRKWLPAAAAAVCFVVVCAVFFGIQYLRDSGEKITESPETTQTAAEAETIAAPPAEAQGDETQGAKAPGVKVKGLYVTAWSAGMADRLARYIEICDTTEINTLVIDIKDDRGQITFHNSIEGAAKASVNIIPDIEAKLSLLKEHGIYAIARLVCFKDPLWSRLHPGLAIKNTRGASWKDGDGLTWLDPCNRASWDHIANLAAEAARLGFDEIQLDYVRFPTNGNLKEIAAAGSEQSRAEIIGEFLQHMQAALAGTGARLSADIFGITAVRGGDFENIGQGLEIVARHADVVCPMVYPSHFANKRQNGVGQVIVDRLFEAPDTEPYDVVLLTLLLAANRLSGNSGNAVIRPYLQDFTAAYLGNDYYQTYTAAQVREQIQAVYDAGLEEWILWNPSGVYSEDALEVK